MAASTTLTIETTSPMIQACDPLEPMIAAMATPMATTPAVAMILTKIRSNGLRRRSRGGSMFLESARARDGAAVAGFAAVVGCLGSGMVSYRSPLRRGRKQCAMSGRPAKGASRIDTR